MIFPKEEEINSIKPIVVYFYIGGISINEIQAIENFKEN